MKAFAIIPALNEGAAIGDLVGDLLARTFCAVIVVDGGSRDDTANRASRSGATVIVEPRRGYGRAVMRGVRAARESGATSMTFLDGNGVVSADDAVLVTAPLYRDGAELVIGWRPARKLRWLQRAGNRLATEVIARAHGQRFFDIGSLRAVSAQAYELLALDELSYGWPLQLHARAAAHALKVVQVPIEPKQRRSASKVSGTIRGRIGASAAFLRVLARECVLPR